MSVVIIGGNECMIRKYKDICSLYKCKAKIYPKMTSGLKNIGSPDLLVLFTNTVSHKMVRCSFKRNKGHEYKNRPLSQQHYAALKSILEEHTA